MSNVNNPQHYNHGLECIDEMEAVFGVRATATFCLLNVWKYRNRSVYKNGEEDMEKAAWYMEKYLELTKSSIIGNDALDEIISSSFAYQKRKEFKNGN